MTKTTEVSALKLLQQQRSHVLLVLAGAYEGHEKQFVRWFQGDYRETISQNACVVHAEHYRQHEVDITRGEFPRLPLPYLGWYELSLDGATAASSLIEQVHLLYEKAQFAHSPATWLYYPMCEKVGRTPVAKPSLLTLAFANGLNGQEEQFREWYATRHIRHALNVPALVSGQCLRRTIFQQPGGIAADFDIVAVYEQEAPPEAIIDSLQSLPESLFAFPTMDFSRFAESVYLPLCA